MESVLQKRSKRAASGQWWTATTSAMPSVLQDMWFFCANVTDQQIKQEIEWCEEQWDIAIEDTLWLDLLSQWVEDEVVESGSMAANLSGVLGNVSIGGISLHSPRKRR